jgi:hypothetical protein
MIALLFLGLGCGKKSVIKNAVPPEKLADAYGDGKYVIRNVTVPISNSSLTYTTPIEGLFPVVGGISKLLGDILVKNTKMGTMQMSYIQPLPAIPDKYLKSVRLKRFFFYMKPQGSRRRIRAFLEELITGRGSVTFDFLNKFAVKVSAVNIKDVEQFKPKLMNDDLKEEKLASLLDIFSDDYDQRFIDSENREEAILIKYSKRTRQKDTRNKSYGQIHILETTKKPNDLKAYLMAQEDLKDAFKRIVLLDQSILVELKPDPVAKELFKKFLSDESQNIEKQLGVTSIDACTPSSCLEVALPDVNLVPLAIKGNALRLDAIIESGSVPESFNLKGFVEIEVKLDSPV